MSPGSAFDPIRFQQRVRDRAQHAIAPMLEDEEAIEALVPGMSDEPERRRRSLGRRGRRRMVVATARHIYVFAYRFGKVREIELKSELGGIRVTVRDEPAPGGGLMTVGDLSLRVGASVWRDWRDQARRVVALNYGG